MNQLKDILVIDDEPAITRAVEKICGAEGMQVTAAASGVEALRYIDHHDFRLALCDIMMHDLDGFEFLEELVRRGIPMPVVMMTGYSTMENAVRSLTSTGAIDYIPKPFTADELMTVIERSLRCSQLLADADSAGIAPSESLSYVPCPSDFYRLGYVSWALMEDEGTARIGVSDLFLKTVEGIREFELSLPGEDLLQGVPCAVAVSSGGKMHNIMCPLSGRILDINANAQCNPSLVERDPYFRGWLYRILPSNPASDLRWLSR